MLCHPSPIYLYIRNIFFSISDIPSTKPEEIAEDDKIASVHPSLPQITADELSTRPHDLCYYKCEEGFTEIGQVESPNVSSHVVLERHSNELSESMHSLWYYYNLGMLTHFFLRDTNPAGATADRLLAIVDCPKVVNEGSDPNILNVLHLQAVVYILQRNNEHPWAADNLRMHRIMHQHGADIKQAEAIKLSNICNMFIPLTCPNSTLFDTMKSIINHDVAFTL